MRNTVIGVMGAGEGATPQDLAHAYELGRLIAEKGWILLTGGRNVGVMESANQGAKSAHGLTVGILPDRDDSRLSSSVDLAIFTDLGNGRNNVNVLSSDVVIACGMGLGTASEVALALKNGKSVILLTEHRESQRFFLSLAPQQVKIAQNPQQGILLCEEILRIKIISMS